MRGLIGKLVQVRFLDHVIEGPGEKNDELMEFMVWGRIQKYDGKILIIRTWELQKGDAYTKKKNNEIAKIIASTILDIHFLEVMPEIQIEGH